MEIAILKGVVGDMKLIEAAEIFGNKPNTLHCKLKKYKEHNPLNSKEITSESQTQ